MQMQKIYYSLNRGFNWWRSQLDFLHSIINDFASVSLWTLHANVQTWYFQYWGVSIPWNNIISSTFVFKTILYFYRIIEFMTSSPAPPPLGLYVIIRSISLGRAGTTREHCGDQGESGAPGGQVEGPVESTGTFGYKIKTMCKCFITTLCQIL